MACAGGTHAQWWLDWHREYGGWRAAGLEVQASVQFTSKHGASAHMWQGCAGGAYQAAYNYGYVFARAFGPTYGTGDVRVMEVGKPPGRLALRCRGVGRL